MCMWRLCTSLSALHVATAECGKTAQRLFAAGEMKTDGDFSFEEMKLPNHADPQRSGRSAGSKFCCIDSQPYATTPSSQQLRSLPDSADVFVVPVALWK